MSEHYVNSASSGDYRPVSPWKEKYIRRVFWNDDDHCYYAIAPAFRGVSAWATTEADALRELDIVLQAVIEIRRKHGWALPEDSQPSEPLGASPW